MFRSTKRNKTETTEKFIPAQLDAKGFPAPPDGFILTHLIVVADQDRSRDFYSNVLGGKVIRQRNPAVVRLGNSWIVINSGGGPTDDKPDVIVAAPETSLLAVRNVTRTIPILTICAAGPGRRRRRREHRAAGDRVLQHRS